MFPLLFFQETTKNPCTHVFGRVFLDNCDSNYELYTMCYFTHRDFEQLQKFKWRYINVK